MEFFGPFACLAMPVAGILSLATTVFWIWMLVDCATKERTDKGYTQLIWIVVIAVTHFIGGILYFLIRRPERIREYGE